MGKIIRWGSAAAIVGAIAIQFVRPPRTNPVTIPERTLAARVPLSIEVAAVLDRSCRDCHSHDTRWPWYSNVAPVSWFVVDHVDHGRRHLNYSDWAQYPQDVGQRLLKDICALAKKETMPLPSYLRVHREARLSDADVAALCDWSDGVLRPLNDGGLNGKWKRENGKE